MHNKMRGDLLSKLMWPLLILAGLFLLTFGHVVFVESQRQPVLRQFQVWLLFDAAAVVCFAVAAWRILSGPRRQVASRNLASSRAER